MRFFGKTHIDFMGKRTICYMVSLSVIVIGMVSIPLKGGLNYGIDFTGGTEIIVQFQQPPNVGDVRDAVLRAGFDKVEVKTFGMPERIMIRTETQGAGTTV